MLSSYDQPLLTCYDTTNTENYDRSVNVQCAGQCLGSNSASQMDIKAFTRFNIDQNRGNFMRCVFKLQKCQEQEQLFKYISLIKNYMLEHNELEEL